ncbi:MAG: AAA family ATPase [Muribaculaceae bacterium]|nr:AAA family ATPase [Muribaculaceae bacterium]
MEETAYSFELFELLNSVKSFAVKLRHEYIMPEHLLREALNLGDIQEVFEDLNINWKELADELDYFLETVEKVPKGLVPHLRISSQFQEMMQVTISNLVASECVEMNIPHIFASMFSLTDSTAAWLIDKYLEDLKGEFLSRLIMAYSHEEDETDLYEYGDSDREEEAGKGGRIVGEKTGAGEKWKDFVVCLNDNLENRNPLIGREKELDRTIQVLCRKEKNNPLHIGEPGVGKTALVYGLARLINEGMVPERLKDAKIYGLEVGSLLAGTQFRGDFEKRLKMIMDGVTKEPNAIIYIDEIHTLVGAGATGEGSMDASNMMKPYLESGKIRFIGSTTYDEYKRHFAKSKGLVRRFSRIDIEEPTAEETINILNQLKGNYEEFHDVKYQQEAIEYAVSGSARHITDRFLPDKAIDLIDEAGAFRQTHPLEGEERNVIDKGLIAEILSKVCKVDAVSMNKDSITMLDTLQERISARIYGQDEAIRIVTEAVQMSKAGLTDDNKPLASLLFVGPTGVGKTELAKALAEELGIGLVRFDMSEYAEKHTVAKLIGSPAGYVGYEDGGLLTDAIRKTPDCVLLLDEIEKAHPDIFNILLQVMDYASLTDNRGNRADFRNVVLIMTSNAGARYARQANVGFASNVSAGSAMMKQVKKTFQPEFINRLSATVIFNDMDRKMASLILDRKLRLLEDKLKVRNITLRLGEDARDYLLSEGFSREYGAREMERVISSRLKPILMREILFGSLKDGGEAEVIVSDNSLVIK